MKRLKVMMMTLMMCLVGMFITSCGSNETLKKNDERMKRTSSEIQEEGLRQKKIFDSLKVVELKTIADSLKVVELETFKNSVELIKYYTSEPNSAGGVDCNIIWKNLSEKTIKYARFTVVPYNEVNDQVKGKHDYNSDGTHTLKVTGPVKSNKVYGHGTYWDCTWYNWTIDYMKIIEIEIEYLDGETISTSDVNIIEQLGYTRG